jgi:uncharacterized protein (DUF2336 family)
MGVSREILVKLQQEPSAEARAAVAKEIGKDYSARLYNRTEEDIAEQIFRLLSRDVEIIVRKALAEEICNSLDLPRDIALKLAHDVEEVSVPFLKHTASLSEDDLIEVVISTKKAAILQAIAGRESISQELSSALLYRNDIEVIRTLAHNKNATLHPEDITDLLSNKTVLSDESVLDALVERGGLPVTVVEKLFNVVSDTLKKQLTETYHLTRHVAEDSVRTARELVTLGIAGNRSANVEKLVEQLHAKKRLTFSIVIRALCNGDLRFFEASMARLANVPTMNARILIMDPGPLGFKSLYQATPMPAGFMAASKAILDIVMESTDFGRTARKDIRQRIVERLMENNMADHIDNLDYMVALLGRTDRHDITYH